MPPQAVEELFIYGGGIDAQYLDSFMHGWKIVQWITFAITLICCICAWFLPVRPVFATEFKDAIEDAEPASVAITEVAE